MSICVAATNVFQRMTKGTLQFPPQTSIFLLFFLCRHKCYPLRFSYPLQPISILRYLLKVYQLENKTNWNPFLKFFSAAGISTLQAASPTRAWAGFSQQKLHSSTWLMRVILSETQRKIIARSLLALFWRWQIYFLCLWWLTKQSLTWCLLNFVVPVNSSPLGLCKYTRRSFSEFQSHTVILWAASLKSFLLCWFWWVWNTHPLGTKHNFLIN